LLGQEALPGAASLHHLARLVKVNLMHRKTLADLLHPPPAATDPTPPAPAAQLNLVFSHAHSETGHAWVKPRAVRLTFA
jgi:hypothetical protein